MFPSHNLFFDLPIIELVESSYDLFYSRCTYKRVKPSISVQAVESGNLPQISPFKKNFASLVKTTHVSSLAH